MEAIYIIHIQPEVTITDLLESETLVKVIVENNAFSMSATIP